jgi:hypothetical protein
MQKEYGKLTPAQFQEFMAILPDVFAMLRDMEQRLAGTPATKFDSAMPGDFGRYSDVYELPFHEHLAWLIHGLNRLGEVKDVAASPDPQEAVLEMLRKRDEIDDVPQHKDFADEDLLGLTYALSRTMQSMATYGRSISSLIQDVREKGNHGSLFKAVRMDRAVIGCPTAMRHIAKAQVRSNKTFFRHLRAALAGPSKKPMIALEPMRYALLMLREMGLDSLSDKELEYLMVELLKVYPRVPGATKNLRAQYQQSRSIKTI